MYLFIFYSASHIADLVHPLETVLDNDIGCAVWFASRGCGRRKLQLDTYEDYVSPARVTKLANFIPLFI